MRDLHIKSNKLHKEDMSGSDLQVAGLKTPEQAQATKRKPRCINVRTIIKSLKAKQI